MGKPKLLYHFTCAHGHAGIEKSRVLLPNKHPFMSGLGPLLWLTDLPEPTPESVGLTSEWQSCDRLAFRYVVYTKAAVHWSEIRPKAPRQIVAILEEFGQPDHWWLARRPLLSSEFELDTRYQRVSAEAAYG